MKPAQITSASILAQARRVLDIEATAIHDLSQRLDDSLVAAVRMILATSGRVVVSGMGKSGHIGRKIAATMASTGTPSLFMHPGEAAHGDLGMITDQDVLLALSNSGETDELLGLLPILKRRAIKVISMTGNAESTLARSADIHLDAGVVQEACPLNLAPTASTTTALALGDALAVALLDARGFSAEDFAMTHPGGSLGRKLLVLVRDVMHAGDQLPVVRDTTALRDALLEISSKGMGMTAVTDATDRLVGVFTDGDLRRVLDRNLDIHTTAVAQVMSPNPKRIRVDELAVAAVQMMEAGKINGLLVVDEDGSLVGALNMHDLLRARVV